VAKNVRDVTGSVEFVVMVL